MEESVTVRSIVLKAATPVNLGNADKADSYHLSWEQLAADKWVRRSKPLGIEGRELVWLAPNDPKIMRHITGGSYTLLPALAPWKT